MNWQYFENCHLKINSFMFFSQINILNTFANRQKFPSHRTSYYPDLNFTTAHSLENTPLVLLKQTWISGKISDQFLQAPTCAQSSERIIRPWRNSLRSWKTLTPCSVKIQLSALWDNLINYSRSFRENLFKSFLSMRHLMTDFLELKSENVQKCPVIYWFHMISP